MKLWQGYTRIVLGKGWPVTWEVFAADSNVSVFLNHAHDVVTACVLLLTSKDARSALWSRRAWETWRYCSRALYDSCRSLVGCALWWCMTYISGWPQPYIRTVYDRIFGDFCANNTVYTQRGTTDPPNGGVFRMLPEYAGYRLLQSNLAQNGSPCHNSSRAVEFHWSKRGPLCLIGRGVNPTFQAPVYWIWPTAAPNHVIKIAFDFILWIISLQQNWEEKIQWLARYRIPAISLGENQPRRRQKGYFLTSLYPIFEHAG